MWGCNSGVFLRVNEELEHELLDVRGCSLHYVHNLVQHAIDAIDIISLEQTISDVYNFFMYHTHDENYKMVTSFLDIENHKFLRNVPLLINDISD